MIKLNNKNITYVALADSNNSLKAPKEIWYADSSNSVKLVYRRKDALIEGEDYEKYHWLDGDGTAYIDTELTLSETDVIETKILNKTIPSTYYIIYGNDSSQFQNLACILFNNEYLRFRPTGTYSDTFIVSQLGTEYAIVQSTTKLIVNNVDKWNGDSVSQISTKKCCIFSAGITAAHSYCYDGKIAYFNISDRINLIPCKLLKPVPKWLDANGIRRQVGECGMIDLISGKFYGNVNSVGTFTVENYYERKEWLVGDGSAYIDTNVIVDVPSLYINTKFTAADFSYYEPLFGSRSNPSESYRGSHIWYIAENKIRVDVLSSDNSLLFCNIQSGVNSLVLDVPNNVISINNVSETGKLSDYRVKNSMYTFHIFNMKILGDTSDGRHPYNGSFGNFTLNDGTHSHTLIPCTLTMDLPASMDANNIARTKGTSGMWDLVSDKFYGNVASSGTFKAVNLAEGVDYEVYDWLVGDGSAYIDTLTALSDSDTVEMKITGGTIPSASQAYKLIFGNNTNSYNYNAWVLFVGSLIAIRPTKTSSADEYRFQISTSQELTISQSTTSITVNGTEVWSGTSAYTETADKCTLFAAGTNVSHCYDGKVAYLKISDKLNLIPCKLLKSLSSKYDANGISRNAGECGMYDTVNDKFYGNVASSGSFTVSDDN